MDMQVHALRRANSVPEAAVIGDTKILSAVQVKTSSTPNSHCALCGVRNACVNCSASTASRTTVGILRKLSMPSKPFHKGQYLYTQDQVFESVYILRSGAVKTYYIDDRGEEHISGFLLPGELFGFDGLGRGRHRYAAVSLDTSAICRIPYRSIEQQVQLQPDLQRWLIAMLCEDIYDRQDALLALRTMPAEERLAAYLLDIASRLKHRGLSSLEIVLPMSRRDIAGYLAVTEETVSRMFTRLQKRKILTVKGRSIFISDQKRLQNLSKSVRDASQCESPVCSSGSTEPNAGINGQKNVAGNVALQRIRNIKILSEAV
jgi:CRP/FNR family transcriptional regulator